MAGINLIYRPGGMMVASDYVQTVAATRAPLPSVVPDAAEHDKGKEAIAIHWIDFSITRAGILSALAAASQIKFSFGFRAGLFTVVAALDTQKWMYRQWFIKRDTLVGIVPIGDLARMDFSADPVIADPSGNTFCFEISSSGADTLDAGAYFHVKYGYKWVKAGAAELNAYLSWEGLGL